MSTNAITSMDDQQPAAARPPAPAGFNDRQLRALVFRQQFPDGSATAAAKFAGVSQTGIRKWLAQPAFRSAWDDATERHRAITTGLRQAGEIEALSKLRAMVAPECDAPAAVQVDAAGKLLAHIDRTRDREEIPPSQVYVQLIGAWAERSAPVLGLEQGEQAAIEGEATPVG